MSEKEIWNFFVYFISFHHLKLKLIHLLQLPTLPHFIFAKGCCVSPFLFSYFFSSAAACCLAIFDIFQVLWEHQNAEMMLRVVSWEVYILCKRNFISQTFSLSCSVNLLPDIWGKILIKEVSLPSQLLFKNFFFKNKQRNSLKNLCFFVHSRMNIILIKYLQNFFFFLSPLCVLKYFTIFKYIGSFFSFNIQSCMLCDVHFVRL